MTSEHMQSVAVLIVTWNASAMIEKALEGLAAQTVAPNRTLLLDNGSADFDQLQAIVGRYPQCELVRLDTNKGFAAANNIGIGLCGDVEYIAMLNPDASPEPDWLERLLIAAAAYPRAASFASRLVCQFHTEMLDGAGDILSISGKPARRGHGMAEKGRFLEGEEVFAPCAAAAMYRRSALQACGGYDEDYFCFVEDIDLGFRLRLLGFGCRYVPDSIAYHIGSASTGRRSDFSVYHGQRNLVYNYVKNMPGALFWLLLPLHISVNLGLVLAGLLTPHGKTIARAKLDAVKQLPHLWKKRREIQGTRRASIANIWRALDKHPFPISVDITGGKDRKRPVIEVANKAANRL